MGVAFYHRGLGDLALARGDWDEAHEQYRAYLGWAATGDTWSRIYALCGVGRAEMGLGRLDPALGRFREALRLAVDSGRRDTVSLPVACLAHLAAAQGRAATAARLAAAVVNSPLTWIETREWAAPLAGEKESEGEGALGPMVAALLGVEGETAEAWVAGVDHLVISQ